jgi:hypothetical protein
MREMRNSYKKLTGKPEGRDYVGDIGPDGREYSNGSFQLPGF